MKDLEQYLTYCRELMKDQEWRLNHLYYINSKSNGLMRFQMNECQREFYRNMWYRNTILKARQLGMSTLISLYMFDCCLFTSNFEAGIIDRTQDDAEEKVAKMKLAYNCMMNPPSLQNDHVTDPKEREMIRLLSQCYLFGNNGAGGIQVDIKKDEIHFSNGSHIRTGLSLRGGTMKLLHISEYGPTAAKDEQRALEIRDGGFNTVPADGCIIIESTHEGGRSGENYRILKNAMDCVGRQLTMDEWKFFFFPWWKDPAYRTKGYGPFDVGHLAPYFDMLEKQHDIHLDEEQKRWYFNKERELGWGVKKEFPSIAEEALMGRVEGSIYGPFILELRKKGLMAAKFEVDEYAPLYVSWDLGMADYMTMWLWQPKGDGKFYVVDYFCSHRKRFEFYFNKCRDWEREYGMRLVHLLPHDSRQTELQTGLPRFMAFEKAFGAGSYRLIPRVSDKWLGIDATKNLLRHCVFHERCSAPVKDIETDEEYMAGVDALENYRTKPNSHSGAEQVEPLHDEASHGADSFRLFAEAFEAGFISKEGGVRIHQDPLSRANAKPKRRAKGIPAWMC